INVLNQKNFLRGLIGKEKVCLDIEPGAQPDAKDVLRAHVRRVSDRVWLNLDMIEKGFATASTAEAFAVSAKVAAAEQRAKNLQPGMWAPDCLANATQHTVVTRKARHGPGFFARLPGPGMTAGGADKNATSSGSSSSEKEASPPKSSSSTDDTRSGSSSP